MQAKDLITFIKNNVQMYKTINMENFSPKLLATIVRRIEAEKKLENSNKLLLLATNNQPLQK
jgi:spore coat protein CotF